MVGEEEGGAFSFFGGVREEFVAGFAGGCLDGETLFFCEGGDVDAVGDEGEFVVLCELADEGGVGAAGAAAGGVDLVEVADDEFAVAAGDEEVEEGDGIFSAGDADEVA